MKTLNNMAMDLQFITEEKVLEFINGMDEVSTDSILDDPSIVQLLKGSVPQQIADQPNPLGTIESFLHLFIDREEYEVCADLVKAVPELGKN